MRLIILVCIYSAIHLVGCIFAAYNAGFDDGYVTGMIAQGLGTDSFENYDMPYTNKDDNKKKW